MSFLPDTLEGSLKIPAPLLNVFRSYLIQFYKSADRLVVVNPSFIDALVEYGIDRERIYYIPNYVSKENFIVNPMRRVLPFVKSMV